MVLGSPVTSPVPFKRAGTFPIVYPQRKDHVQSVGLHKGPGMALALWQTFLKDRDFPCDVTQRKDPVQSWPSQDLCEAHLYFPRPS